jgi:signal transduction histidine kinase
MEDLDTLAALVQGDQEHILREWRREVRATFPNKKEFERPILEDGVRNFLDELSNALLEAHDKGAPPQQVEFGPAIHGVQRYKLDTKIDELVGEFAILRRALLLAAERKGIHLHGPGRYVLHQLLDGAIARAVREFANAQTADHEYRREERMAMIVHDLKTPLGAIHTASKLLEGRLSPEAKESVRTMLGIIFRNCENLDAMLMRLLERASRDEMVLHANLNRTFCNLRPLIDDLLEAVTPLAQKASVPVFNDVPKEFRLDVDAFLIKQALQNLLSNALRYTEHGEIRIGAAYGKQQVDIWVNDTGPGISEERLKNVFERREVDPLRTESTGLGLAIVKRIVDAHNGQVHAKSEPGKGTSVVITLPQFGMAESDGSFDEEI